ncbi:hypothetical protein BJ138DRAFT_1180066 [Hygrophoropsis aurantiaca]|uniref:Uncharacterized protein n=1 Tax=Hygrophoropsis aurantiaca TaxID=72124 RepID=A0ACB8ADJ2_9AGAM|nr:hypothetical protein BJ138DRAFT_1180066 [Hygrophoropsis aurantiaca]
MSKVSRPRETKTNQTNDQLLIANTLALDTTVHRTTSPASNGALKYQVARFIFRPYIQESRMKFQVVEYNTMTNTTAGARPLKLTTIWAKYCMRINHLTQIRIRISKELPHNELSEFALRFQTKFYYGYMIPRSLFFEKGSLLKAPYTEEMHNAGTVDMMTRFNAWNSIVAAILDDCGFDADDRVKRKPVFEDGSDKKWWFMIAVAYSAPEWYNDEKYLRRFPEQAPQERMQKLKELFNLKHDEEPVWRKSRTT